MEVEAEKKNDKSNFLLDEHIFQMYYQHFFPAKEMVQWLSYEHYGKEASITKDIDFFTKREFSFTYPGDIYQRYQSYKNETHLRKQLVDSKPEKIDIGAVFENIPNKNSINKPVQREFVIDIDMTDYDEVRTCCSEANICYKCWEFMKAAGHVLSQALQNNFGFENILWVYSGRRGIHLWVCEESVRKMTNEVRSSVIDNLNLVLGSGENLTLKHGMINTIDHKSYMHPSLKNSVSILQKYFTKIESQQQVLVKKPQIVETLINNRDVENGKVLWAKINTLWQKTQDSLERLKILEEQIKIHNETQKNNSLNQINYFKEELIMVLLYPRLDVNVSKTMNHLLKAPFSLHPKTGKVCVPFTDKQFDSFDPFTSPHMFDLYNYQIKKDKYAKENKDFNDKNPMEDYTNIMKEFVQQVCGIQKSTSKIQKRAANKMEEEDGTSF